VTNGQAYAVPRNTPVWVRARVVNLGPAKWLARGKNGVRFAANERFGLGLRRSLAADVARLGEAIIPETRLTSGLTDDATAQLQMVAEGRAWIDGAVRVRLLVY
jgi:hypothetical protein